MTSILSNTDAHGMILNLRNAAEHHERTCDENCAVSLLQLHQTAVFIAKHAMITGDSDVARWLSEMEKF